MFITIPPNKRIVVDYDITFINGMVLPITIDIQAEDTLITSEDGKHIIIHLTPKPGLSDPTKLIPAEDITIFTTHVVSIQSREREVVGLTPDQQEQWTKALESLERPDRKGQTVQ